MGTNLLLVPVDNVFSTPQKRSFVYTMFTCPLVKGEQYKLSFIINTAGRSFDHLDFLFSASEPSAQSFDPFTFKPSVRITSEHLLKSRSPWKEVEYIYTANGDERFCLIGNLSPDKMGYGPPDRMNSQGQVYYFLDDMLFFPINKLPVCEDMNVNVKRLYAQNKRHTEGASVLAVEQVKQPRFVNDTITIPTALFETGSAKLKPGFIKIMDSILTIFPQKKIIRIDISGHTDNKGKRDNNELLSKARAEEVKKYLLEKMPQYTDLVNTFGFADDHPVASNDTETGRRLNRRVEIVLTCIQQVE